MNNSDIFAFIGIIGLFISSFFLIRTSEPILNIPFILSSILLGLAGVLGDRENQEQSE